MRAHKFPRARPTAPTRSETASRKQAGVALCDGADSGQWCPAIGTSRWKGDDTSCFPLLAISTATRLKFRPRLHSGACVDRRAVDRRRCSGPDKEPLYIPIGGDRLDLHANGCSGSLRLEAVDGDYHPVEAPVAYVEVSSNEAPAARNVAPTDGQADLVRSSLESMTRVMEAMQRAQIERERAIADRERAVTEAQVANNRSNVELMIALIDRATGGKPQDPVTVLEQHVKLQKVIERQAAAQCGIADGNAVIRRGPGRRKAALDGRSYCRSRRSLPKWSRRCSAAATRRRATSRAMREQSSQAVTAACRMATPQRWKR